MSGMCSRRYGRARERDAAGTAAPLVLLHDISTIENSFAAIIPTSLEKRRPVVGV
jgi:hypothetical protein